MNTCILLSEISRRNSTRVERLDGMIASQERVTVNGMRVTGTWQFKSRSLAFIYSVDKHLQPNSILP